jgi:hypothetical protein
MRYIAFIGGICFLLGAMLAAMAATAIRPDQFVALAWSWTATQTFDSSHTVTGLPTPSSSSDAATKGYVDGLSSGALTLISTQTASTSADLRWTGLGSTYNVYLLTCTDVIPSTTSTNLLTQFGEGGTPTWETSSYASAAGTLNSGNGSNSQTATAGFIWNSIVLVNNGDGVQGQQWIHGIASTTLHKFVTGTSAISYNTSGDAGGNTMIGTYKGDVNAITAIRVISSSGNLASGKCSLYGLVP